MDVSGRWLSKSADPQEFVDLELRQDGTFQAYGAESHVEGKFTREGDVLRMEPSKYLGYTEADFAAGLKTQAMAGTVFMPLEANVDEKNNLLQFKLGRASQGTIVNLFKTPIVAPTEDPKLNSAEQALVGEYVVAYGKKSPDLASDMTNRIGTISSRIILLPDKTFRLPSREGTAGTWKIGNAEVILTEKKKSGIPLRLRVEKDGLYFDGPNFKNLTHHLVKR